jgi:para-aminobenzoate synthetase component I
MNLNISSQEFSSLRQDGYNKIPLIHKYQVGVDVLSLFSNIKVKKKSLLQSHKHTGDGRYSFICFDFVREFFLLADGCLYETRKHNKILSNISLSHLETLIDSWKPVEGDGLSYGLPFWGGLLTLLSYEFGAQFEKLQRHSLDDVATPDAIFLLVDTVIVYDHMHSCLYLCCVGDDYETLHLKLKYFNKLLLEALSTCKICDNTADIKAVDTLSYCSSFSKDSYCRAIEKIQTYIKDGHSYQVNLSQRFSRVCSADSFDIYKVLSRQNPVDFGAYFKFEDFSLVCVSPERLFKKTGNSIVTRPIAGTKKKDKRDISLQREEFLSDKKELAEHAMLVDLERNDLGRICQTGTVKIDSFCDVVDYKTIMHMESLVSGVLRDTVSFFDILRAVFPGGTVTGVPKIRTIEIIAELEKYCRGFYTGSLGYVGYNKNMDLNIIIRSIVCKNSKVYIQVGGGVTHKSIPEKEYQETLSKAYPQMLTIETLLQGCRNL